MAQLGRKEAEQLIKEILTEYARKIRSAKKREYAEDIQQKLFNPKIDAFYKLVKSEDMDFCIFNRLNDEGIRQLLVGCRRLAKSYELDSYGKIKDFTYEPESPKCRIASDSDGKYTAGGSYTFTVEGKAELGNKWYEPHSVAWHFYRENPGTGKYEETSSKMDEARALADFDTWDRSFLVSEKGRYKVTATIFNQAITTGIRPDIVEVCELYFEARDDSDAEIVKLSTFEKCVLAISYADFGEAFKNLGLDIAAVAVTVVAFVGIGVILKKIPAGKVKPLLMKLARKLNLSELLEFFGKVGDAFDVVALIESICSFYEQASNARNREHLKAAGKTLEKIVEALGLFAVFDFMTIIGGRMKKADVENEIKALDDVPKRKVEVNDIIGKKANGTNKGVQKSIKFVNGQITGEITDALKTEPGTAFFLSGCAKVDPLSGRLLVSGDEVAAEIARKCGGTTLESLIKENNIEMPKLDYDVPESIKAWEDVSAVYAKQASGDVRAIVGKKLQDGNIWEKVELPALMQNPNVSKITTIDPDTMAEIIVFERKAGTVYVKANETLIKNGDWDKVLDSISKNSEIVNIEEIDTGLELYNKNWHNLNVRVRTVSERINQYDSVKNIVTSGGGGGSPSQILRENLKNAGIEPPPYPNAAHHIVAVDSPKAAASRQILDTYNIDLNSPANGVFLPMKESKYVSSESMHSGGHSNSYYKEVFDRLQEIQIAGKRKRYTDIQIQQLLCTELQEIRSDLLTGKLKIHS